MRVIGTAGHVDHGKSTLVTALTGINPDRLKEEQLREMTIELGFAWLALPNGETVGVVDVPGHRDFIENMLAGVGGIDAVLFVVASDEGVMPQTKEHLVILDLLQIPGGIIVLTKSDLIEDPEWFDLLEMDIHQIVQGTILEHAPIVRVSARTGAGLAELKEKIVACLSGQPVRTDFDRPRLSIDRIFSIQGFGTVATGTLLDGHLQTGDEVVIYPSEIRGRIRGLQTHKQKVDMATPGSRTAVNISGIDFERVKRGDLLSLPGKYTPTKRLDVHFRLQKDVLTPVKHNQEVKFFLGAAEVSAKARLLAGVEEFKPGTEGWLQLELSEPVIAVRGDRFILRRPSPGETLGGGVVIEPQPAARHKRSAMDVVARLESLRIGTPRDILWHAWLAAGIAPLRDVVTKSRLAGDAALQVLEELIQSGEVIQLEGGKLSPQADTLFLSTIEWERLSREAARELSTFHKAYSLRKGMNREEFRNKLKLNARAFNAIARLWVQRGLIKEAGSLVALSEHQIRYTPEQQQMINRLLARFESAPFSPPSVKECVQETGEEIYNTLLDSGNLIQVSPEVVFRSKDYAVLLDFVRNHLKKESQLTVIQFRDQFNTSRKYALGFLEHLDSLGVTRREGDYRIAGRN